MPNREMQSVLRIVALDGHDHKVSIETTRDPYYVNGTGPASRAFSAHTLELAQSVGKDAGGNFYIAISHEGEHTAGYDPLGNARDHGVQIRMQGVADDGLTVESSTTDASQLVFEREFVDGMYDRVLWVPLISGHVSLELSQLELTRPQR